MSDQSPQCEIKPSCGAKIPVFPVGPAVVADPLAPVMSSCVDPVGTVTALDHHSDGEFLCAMRNSTPIVVAFSSDLISRGWISQEVAAGVARLATSADNLLQPLQHAPIPEPQAAAIRVISADLMMA